MMVLQQTKYLSHREISLLHYRKYFPVLAKKMNLHINH